MNKADLAIAEKLMSDPYWRINNLYSIVDKKGEKIPFRLNSAQESLYRNLWYCNVVLKCRQVGVSTLVCLIFLDRCLFNSNMAAGIIAHTREDAELLFKRIKSSYDSLPPEIKSLRPATSDSARELVFSNGSSLRVGTSMRGATLQYLHISEFGKICAKFPEKANEIITGSLNTISAGQYVIIESTAEGRSGHFYEICKQAQELSDSGRELSKLDFRFHFFPWYKNDEYRLSPDKVLISKEFQDYFSSLELNEKITLDQSQRAWYVKKYQTQGGDMKREYPSTPTESFEAANEGLYYGAQIARCRQENRIRKVFLDENTGVFTAWDLGFGDSTAIWFYQICGQEIHLLDYYENSGEALTHYIKFVKDKPYDYLKHFVPHDAAVHEFSTGLSRVEVARNHGMRFTIVPKLGVNEGIDAVRNLLHRCFFDEEKCIDGIKKLESYKRAWNPTLGVWRQDPLHDASSHCSDSFRTLAVGLGLANPGHFEDALAKHRNLVKNRKAFL